MVGRKTRSPAENEVVGRKIQTSTGKSKLQLNFRISGWKFKSSAEDLKLPARAEKFRDFEGFPAELLNFRLTIRISSDRAEMLPTTSGNLRKSAIFRLSLDQRPAAERILPQFDISSDSFAPTAEKTSLSLINFQRKNGICFAACKSIVPVEIWHSG